VPRGCQKGTVYSPSFAEHFANPSTEGGRLVISVLRNRRRSALPLYELSRSVSRLGTSVTTGTPASEFVASRVLRHSSVQRNQECSLRSVTLRMVAFAYRQTPRSTLKRVFVELRRTARRRTSRRIFERFASQGRVSGPESVQVRRSQLRIALDPSAGQQAVCSRSRRSKFARH
jgi:hypothetical protein